MRLYVNFCEISTLQQQNYLPRKVVKTLEKAFRLKKIPFLSENTVSYCQLFYIINKSKMAK